MYVHVRVVFELGPLIVCHFGILGRPIWPLASGWGVWRGAEMSYQNISKIHSTIGQIDQKIHLCSQTSPKKWSPSPWKTPRMSFCSASAPTQGFLLPISLPSPWCWCWGNTPQGCLVDPTKGRADVDLTLNGVDVTLCYKITRTVNTS